MTPANVDVVRSSYDAFNRRDLDAMLEAYDPEVVWEQDEGFVEPGTHYGHAGVRHVFNAIFEGFEKFRIATEELHDIDEERVLAVVNIVATGKLSGLRTENSGGHIFWFREGRITRVQLYLDPAEAREAAGLGASAQKSG
jgi:ketosteroid isomerase-like protein